MYYNFYRIDSLQASVSTFKLLVQFHLENKMERLQNSYCEYALETEY